MIQERQETLPAAHFSVIIFTLNIVFYFIRYSAEGQGWNRIHGFCREGGQRRKRVFSRLLEAFTPDYDGDG